MRGKGDRRKKQDQQKQPKRQGYGRRHRHERDRPPTRNQVHKPERRIAESLLLRELRPVASEYPLPALQKHDYSAPAQLRCSELTRHNISRIHR